MKKLALVFTAVFLIGTTVSAKTTNALEDDSSINRTNSGYGNSFIFTEGGIEFSVFPDGQFDFYAPDYGPDVNVSINTPNVAFSFNSGYDYSPYVQYDDFGAIIQIENTPIYYDYYGRVTQVGNVDINYNDYGRVARVGGLYLHYNNYHQFTHYTGYINVYNRAYVYRPWHVYYAVPAPSFCIVYARPYRQYYTPVRYHYYRPYTNNYRQTVHYDQRRVTSNNSGRRGTSVANNRSVSDRYRQDASPRRGDSSVGRNNVRNAEAGSNVRSGSSNPNGNTVRSSGDRVTQSSTNNGRAYNASTRKRTNDLQRNANTSGVTRSTTGTRASQAQRSGTNERNARATTQRKTTTSRNTSAIGKTTQRVNNLPNRKPNTSNTRISNNKQQQRSTTQRSSSQQRSKQPSSRTKSKRGN